MNKNEIIKKVSKQSNLTQKECLLCLTALKQVMVSAFSQGDDISFSGFGRFYVKHYDKRNSFNPQTGQINTLKARKLPVFKVSSVLKGKI